MPCQCGCTMPEDQTDESRAALERAKRDAERRAEDAERRLAEALAQRP